MQNLAALKTTRAKAFAANRAVMQRVSDAMKRKNPAHPRQCRRTYTLYIQHLTMRAICDRLCPKYGLSESQVREIFRPHLGVI